jgi:hypothetical protein
VSIELLERTTIAINRRRFLKRAVTAVFGIFAGLAVGVPAALAANCTAPAGDCRSSGSLCNGINCGGTQYISCQGVHGYCGEHSCWTSGSGTCCDCYCCTYYGSCFVCYCYG